MNERKLNKLTAFACILGTLFYFYETLLETAPSTIVQGLMGTFHLSGAQVGFLDTAYFVTYAVMQIPGGSLLDRFGARRLLTLAASCCAIGMLGLAHTHSFHVALVFRMIAGFGGTFGLMGAMYLINKYLPSKYLAFFLGLCIMVGLSGGLLQQPMTNLVKVAGWQNLIELIGTIGACLAIVFALVLKDNGRPTTTVFGPLWQNVKEVLRTQRIWPIALYGGLVYIPTGTFASFWGIEYLKSYYGPHAQVSFATLNSLIFLGWIIGSPIAGYISDRLHNRRNIMLAGALGALLSFMAITWITNLTPWMMGFLLLCVGIFSSCSGITFAMGCETVTKSQGGTAIGFVNMMAIIPSIICSPIIGAILDHYWTGTMMGDIKLFTFNAYQHGMLVEMIVLTLAVIIAGFFIPAGESVGQKHRALHLQTD